MPASRNFKGHLVTEILSTYDINSDRLAIVESVTCHVQDLDMVVSKPFKGRLCIMCMANCCYLELPFPLRKHTVTILIAAGAVD